MNSQKQLVKLAEEKGYNHFHTMFFENAKLSPETWYLELILLKIWLFKNHNISISIETGWLMSNFIFEIVLWIGCEENFIPECFDDEVKALEYGLEQGLILI